MFESLKSLLCQYQLLIIERDNFRSNKINLTTKEKIQLLEDIELKKDEIINYCIDHLLVNEQTKLFD